MSPSKPLSETLHYAPVPTEVRSPFKAITELPLLILVGLTGVGKSTLVQALQTQGLTFSHLPNRRWLTDKLMISPLQISEGHHPRPVRDRVTRFEYTARYRNLNPGGMAHALSKLAINVTQLPSPHLFDGLRGLNEVHYAAENLPQARFVVLTAPNWVRLKRLLNRGDAFDTVSPDPSHNDASLLARLQALPKLNTVFNPTQLEKLASLPTTLNLPADTVYQKIKIIVSEQVNYDNQAALSYLQQSQPPHRVLVLDTAAFTAPELAQNVELWLG